MPEQWFVAHDGRTRGPIAEAEVVDLVRRGGLPWDAWVWRGSVARWVRLGECEALVPARQEREAREDGVPLTVLPPPPGEPWFYPVSAFTVAALNLATLGIYRLVWRHQHRLWALRRAGLPTSPLGRVYGYDFFLPLELAEAAEQTGVRPLLPLFQRPTVADGCSTNLGILLFVICTPLVLVLIAGRAACDDARQQVTANRVNRVAAPRVATPLVGWAEVAVLGALSLVWYGVLAYVRMKLLG
ncbi:MAG TPA: DUF4339 domain-containing protein [Vicinamibacteria bacterium]|nr:DUF4339 domain-containing protein [Vicinamibacteria bacterium]